MNSSTPLSSIISLPSVLVSDSTYRLHSSTALVALLHRCGVPYAQEVINALDKTLESHSILNFVELLCYSTDFGIAQALASTLKVLGLLGENPDFLIRMLPYGSSGYPNIQSSLNSIFTFEDHTQFLKRLSYPSVDPFTFVENPLALTDWIKDCDPSYASMMQALKTLNIEEFTLLLVQQSFSNDLLGYVSLTKEIRSIVYSLYSTEPLGSELDRSTLGR